MAARNRGRRKASPEQGKWFLLLFSLPFAGVGVVCGGIVLWTLVEWRMMQSWQPVPCRILQADLEVNHGDDSTTYKATASYTYEWNGELHTGSRVGLHTSADNLGSWHEDIAVELKQAVAAGRPWPGYVNPDQPDEAVLDRTLRYGKLLFLGLFALVFGGVGFGILFGSAWARRRELRHKAVQAENPDEPWLIRDDWAAGRIRSSGLLGAAVLGGMGVLFSAISSPAVVAIPAEMEKGNTPILLVLLFPMAGLFMLGSAGYLVLRSRRWGQPEFVMASVPGVIGGGLAGVIRCSRFLEPRDGWQLSLSCIRRTNGRKNNHESIVWQERRTLARGLDGDQFSGTAVPVYFAIPYDARPSDSEGESSINWELELKADVPGIDFAATFEVPVFRTAASSEDYEPLDALADYEHEITPEEHVRAAGLRLTETFEGFRIRQPMPAQLGIACGTTLFTAIWVGVVWFLWHLGAPLLFPIVFGLFGLLMVWISIDMWLWSSTIEVEPGSLTVRSGLPLKAERRHFTAFEIHSLKPVKGMQSGRQVYYSLKLRTGEDRGLTILRHLPGRVEAEKVAALIAEKVGFEPEGNLSRSAAAARSQAASETEHAEGL